MPSFVFLVVLVALFASAARAETYARVCVTTVDAESKEAPLTDDSSSGPGKKLVVHLDASTECTALIVPLTQKGSRLANGWRPQTVVLPQWEERTLPNSNALWTWKKGADPFELWIFFFKKDDPAMTRIYKMGVAMQNSSDEQMLAEQTRKLCEQLSTRMSGKEQIALGPKANTDLIGGVRGTEFPWRTFAHKVVLNDALEGELVLRHD
jgi:hypothetical protein